MILFDFHDTGHSVLPCDLFSSIEFHVLQLELIAYVDNLLDDPSLDGFDYGALFKSDRVFRFKVCRIYQLHKLDAALFPWEVIEPTLFVVDLDLRQVSPGSLYELNQLPKLSEGRSSTVAEIIAISISHGNSLGDSISVAQTVSAAMFLDILHAQYKTSLSSDELLKLNTAEALERDRDKLMEIHLQHMERLNNAQ